MDRRELTGRMAASLLLGAGPGLGDDTPASPPGSGAPAAHRQPPGRGERGSSTVNVVPSSAVEWARMVPPCARTICAAM